MSASKERFLSLFVDASQKASQNDVRNFSLPPVNVTLMQPICSIVCFSALVVLLSAMMRGKIATASVRNLTRGKIRGS